MLTEVQVSASGPLIAYRTDWLHELVHAELTCYVSGPFTACRTDWLTHGNVHCM